MTDPSSAPTANDSIVVNNMNNPGIGRNLLSKFELTEFQRVVAVVAYDGNAEDGSMKDQESYIYDAIHGRNGLHSQLDLLVKGKNRYAKVYNIIEGEAIVDPRSNTILPRTINSIYSPNNNTRELIAGREIKVRFLQRATLNRNVLITGRSLLSMAKDVIKNCKKALAYANAFLDTEGNLPSGTNIDDLLDHVKEAMRADQLSTNPTVLDEEGNSRPRTVDTNSLFKGYVAFCLFACPIITEQGDRLQVFCIGGEKEGKSSSRAAAAKRKAAVKNEKRSNQRVALGDRGMTATEDFNHRNLHCQNLATLQAEISDSRKLLYNPIRALNERYTTLMTERAQAIQLFRMYKDMKMDVKADEAANELVELCAEVKALKASMVLTESGLATELAANKEKEKQLNGLLDEATAKILRL